MVRVAAAQNDGFAIALPGAAQVGYRGDSAPAAVAALSAASVTMQASFDMTFLLSRVAFRFAMRRRSCRVRVRTGKRASF